MFKIRDKREEVGRVYMCVKKINDKVIVVICRQEDDKIIVNRLN